jgi:hypothetical protein
VVHREEATLVHCEEAAALPVTRAVVSGARKTTAPLGYFDRLLNLAPDAATLLPAGTASTIISVGVMRPVAALFAYASH